MTEALISIRPATEADVPLLLVLIRELAEYEKLLDEVVATEELLRTTLFGERRTAEVIIGYCGEQPMGFALFFHTFSTFLGRPGIYVEDLFVKPPARAHGLGLALLVHIAQLAQERGCGRLEGSALNWNTRAIRLYKHLGAISLDEWTMYRITGPALEALAQRRG